MFHSIIYRMTRNMSKMSDFTAYCTALMEIKIRETSTWGELENNLAWCITQLDFQLMAIPKFASKQSLVISLLTMSLTIRLTIKSVIPTRLPGFFHSNSMNSSPLSELKNSSTSGNIQASRRTLTESISRRSTH